MKPNTALEPALHSGRLLTAEHARNCHFVNIPAGLPPDDLLRPAFWKHVAAQLRPLDRLECISEDGAWERELRVLYTTTQEARVSPIGAVTWHAEEVREVGDDDGPYTVRWKGPTKKWAVIRNSDGAYIADTFPSRETAEAEKAQLLKVHK